MRYTAFEFENFKGIRKGRLDLDDAPASHVFTLVGLNESGKTTILEAIDSFQSSDDEVSPKELGGLAEPDPHSLMPMAETSNFNEDIVLRAHLELDEEDVEHFRRELKARDGYQLTDLNRSIALADIYKYVNSQYDRRQSVWTGLRGTGKVKRGSVERKLSSDEDRDRWLALTGLIRDRMPPIWYFPNFLFDFPERIYVEEYPEETLANRFYRALFQDVLSSLRNDLHLTTHVVERARSEKDSDHANLEQVLVNAGRHLTRTIVRSWNEMFTEKKLSSKEVKLDYGIEEVEGVDEQGEPLADRIWVRFRILDDDVLFTVRQRSLGFRWFFVYLLITAYRSGRESHSPNMLLLFDEPASNLHPSAQTALLNSLDEMSTKATIIYTTHSHYLINPHWLGATYVVANEGLGTDGIDTEYQTNKTNIQITPYRRFAAEHPDQDQFFQPILEVLNWAPAQLEFVPSVCMVEGKSDYYLLEYFQTVMLDDPDHEPVPFLPGGGAGTLDDVIQLYLGWSRPFVALLDSDKTGSDQAKRYLDKFGRTLEPHLLSLAQASGNADATGIESLLTDSDRLALQRLIDPASTEYKKKVLALGVQEALVTHTTVKMGSATRARLKKVIKTARERLETLS